MTELSIKNRGYYKRIIFPKGKQRDFLGKTQTKLDLTLKDFAGFVGICVRSMTDWKREKYSISSPALKKICQKTQTPLPKNIKSKDQFWYVYKGGKVGGLAVYKKYGKIGGNSEYRKKKWYEWWRKIGRFNPNKYFIAREIALPEKNTELAEFIGIVLGDGSIAKKQVTITLNRLEDRDFVLYVKNLIRKLFVVVPSIIERKDENVFTIIISRTKLVQFLVDMGLLIGSKVEHQINIPSWIKKSDVTTKSCLRGLFDTDGCLYIDKHNYKDKIYYNIGMNFTNRSLPILFFFKRSLEKLGFHPTQKTEFSVFLRKEDEIIDYFRRIGSSHPKYLKKFKEYLKNKYGEVPKWL